MSEQVTTLTKEHLRSGLWALRRPGPMVAISVVYLIAATVIMTWRQIEVSPDYILLLLVPLALLAGQRHTTCLEGVGRRRK